MTALEIMKRMAAATGSPHYGGIDPDEVGINGFCLPGGGMTCQEDLGGVTIDVCSVGGVVRLRVRLEPDGRLRRLRTELIPGLMYSQPYVENGDTTSSFRGWHPPAYYAGYFPRERDWERMAGWLAVARGQSDRIPWHRRPADATDDPIAVAIEYYQTYGSVPCAADLLRRLPSDGPEVARRAVDIAYGRIVVRDDAHRVELLLDAAVRDFQSSVTA